MTLTMFVGVAATCVDLGNGVPQLPQKWSKFFEYSKHNELNETKNRTVCGYHCTDPPQISIEIVKYFVIFFTVIFPGIEVVLIILNVQQKQMTLVIIH